MSELHEIEYQLQSIPLDDSERERRLVIEMCVIMQAQNNDIIKLQSEVKRLLEAVPQAGKRK